MSSKGEATRGGARKNAEREGREVVGERAREGEKKEREKQEGGRDGETNVFVFFGTSVRFLCFSLCFSVLPSMYMFVCFYLFLFLCFQPSSFFCLFVCVCTCHARRCAVPSVGRCSASCARGGEKRHAETKKQDCAAGTECCTTTNRRTSSCAHVATRTVTGGEFSLVLVVCLPNRPLQLHELVCL